VPLIDRWYWRHPVATPAGLTKRLALGPPKRGAIDRTYFLDGALGMIVRPRVASGRRTVRPCTRLTRFRPRVVLGMPAYNRPDVLARTLESLFSQTFRDFALVIVDDCPSSETARDRRDVRARVSGNPLRDQRRRLGMVGNWRKVFARARELYPKASYFAWVSDHDVWHARWLQELVSVLDEYPGVVLAYPMRVRMLPDRSEIEKKTFDTFGMMAAAQRMRHAVLKMPAGDVVYGLMRVEALEACRRVPARAHAPTGRSCSPCRCSDSSSRCRKCCGIARFSAGFDIARQREVFFTKGRAPDAYLPSHLQHCATLLWDFAVKGRGRPIGRTVARQFRAPCCSCGSRRFDNSRCRRRPWRMRLDRRRGCAHLQADAND
jgi:hypothetical protein